MCHSIITPGVDTPILSLNVLNGTITAPPSEENAWDGHHGIAHLCWRSIDEFLELYDHTAAAILKVLPGALVGPGNFGAMGTKAEVSSGKKK